MSTFNNIVKCYECGAQLYYMEFINTNKDNMLRKISTDPVVISRLSYYVDNSFETEMKEMLDVLKVTKKCCRSRYLGNTFVHRV